MPPKKDTGEIEAKRYAENIESRGDVIAIATTSLLSLTFVVALHGVNLTILIEGDLVSH